MRERFPGEAPAKERAAEMSRLLPTKTTQSNESLSFFFFPFSPLEKLSVVFAWQNISGVGRKKWKREVKSSRRNKKETTSILMGNKLAL